MDKKEQLYTLYLYKNPELFSSVKNFYFTDEKILEFYNVGKDYYDRLGEIPPIDKFEKTLKRIVSSTRRYDLDTDDIAAFFKESVDSLDPNWLKESFSTWVKVRSFTTNFTNTSEYIKSQDITPHNVDDVLHKARQIFNDVTVELDDDLGVDYFDANTRKITQVPKIDSGKEFLNDVLDGGFKLGTLVCYLGQQGVGKSLWMCNDAAHFVLSGYNTLYISAEMDEGSVMKRIDSIMLDIPIANYKQYIEDVDGIGERLSELNMMGVEPGKLRIKQMVDPTALDVEDYVRRVEKYDGVKYKVVIIDYIGIMANHRSRNSENMYLNIKHISKDLRDIGAKNDWLMLTAMQIGKGAWDKSTLKISDIAESAGLTHNADLVLGIIQSPTMYDDAEYWLKILKVRDGDARNLKCRFNVNKHTLKLTETDHITTETEL